MRRAHCRAADSVRCGHPLVPLFLRVLVRRRQGSDHEAMGRASGVARVTDSHLWGRRSALLATVGGISALILAWLLLARSPDPSHSPTPTLEFGPAFPLSTSSWGRTSGGGMEADLSGWVRQDAAGCIYIGSASGAAGFDVVWPEGFTARELDSGVVIVNQSGRVVARVGERIGMGGGMFRPGEASGEEYRPNIVCRVDRPSDSVGLITESSLL